MNRLNKSLIGGSLIMLIAFNLFNLINFIFQFSMVRLLTIEEYGVFATLFAIIYILGVFSDSIQTVVAKYSSGDIEKGKLKNILKRACRKSILFSSILYVAFAILSLYLSTFLKINYFIFLITGLMIFVSFLIPVTRGVLLGQKKFKQFGLNLISESSFKLITSIILVLIGFRIYGAMMGVIIGSTFAIILSFIPLSSIIRSKENNENLTGIYSYTTPVFIVTFITVLFYSLDVIIAKIVFDETTAGYYAISSLLAKTLLWGTQPISKAMFPLSAENNSRKESGSIFLTALLLIIICLSAGLTLFYFFSDFVIKIFTGELIRQSSDILIYISIGMGIISISYLFFTYKLSKKQTKGYYFLFIGVIIEAIVLFYFSGSLLSFSRAYVFSSIIFLILSILLLRK